MMDRGIVTLNNILNSEYDRGLLKENKLKRISDFIVGNTPFNFGHPVNKTNIQI